jgi:hypothetical protein
MKCGGGMALSMKRGTQAMRSEEIAPESVLVPINAVPAPIRLVEAELLAPDPVLAQEEHRLARLGDLRHALAAIRAMPEALHIRSAARALEVFLRQRQYSREMINDAVEIYLRASRRGGEILLTMEKNKGAATQSHDESAPPTLAQLGLDRNQSSRLQRLARIPPAHFEVYLAETKAAHEPLSAVGLLRYHQLLERREKQAAETAPEPDTVIEATALTGPAASPPDLRPAIAEEIVTRVMAYVREALADVPASVLQAGFAQAVEELRQRIAALPGLAPHERKDTPCATS